MRIAEIYSSIQGEGLLTGTPSVFVRASGCNLRCSFCDTPYTSWEPEGEDWSVDDILAEARRLTSSREAQEVKHGVVTGGEPMLFAELLPLCEGLHAAGFHITIETAGTLLLPVVCDLMSISPKLSNSTPDEDRAGKWRARHEQSRHQPQVIRRLLRDYEHQVKFVIDTRDDLSEVQEWLAEFPEVARDRVLLMPQGVDPAQLERTGSWLAEYCAEQGFVFCPRKHIEWFGAVRGT